MHDFFQKLIILGQSLGYPGLAILMFINTALGFPPSELICVGFGALAAKHQINIYLVIIIATISNLLGTCCWYYIAKHSGKNKIDMLFRKIHRSRYNKLASLFGFGKDAIEIVYRAYKNSGKSIILFGRNIPLIRSVISIPAGVTQMPPMQFIFLSLIGIKIWVIIWCLLGYYLVCDPISIRFYSVLIGAIVIIIFISFKLSTNNKSSRSP
ncbi:MAG: hypothetical protein A2Y10_06025 [Planctomycetes bacterium GWF2_41_51]|nr:MAG: hypothetical protein A2Y10_06025 [Planctomycetes bacterium GWF2_41_51]